VDEVLAQQSEPVQRFLMYTSILDRFCAPLCDVMLEEIWIDQDEFSSQTILHQLREANLFLIALDSGHMVSLSPSVSRNCCATA
jgi:LuxR family maltose regulon positive regulatory protein